MFEAKEVVEAEATQSSQDDNGRETLKRRAKRLRERFSSFFPP